MPNAIYLSISLFLMLMVGCTYAGYRYIYKPGRYLKQLGNPVIDADKHGVFDDGSEPQSSSIVGVLRQLGARVPSSEKDMAGLRTMLMQAGYRSENAAPVFFGLRVVAAATLLVLAILFQVRLPENQALRMGLLMCGVMTGWILPKFVVEKQVKKRKEIMRLSLPDALDMLVVSIEAGLGLDQALQHVAREVGVSHPELSEELTLVTLEMRAGKRRSDALRQFAERTGEDEVKKLIAILVQNDRFGTSMGESLRSHSDHMRVQRRQEAEERAAKVGVKLVFPIFFFIMPSMVIVSAGPGLLQIFKDLFPMMKAMH